MTTHYCDTVQLQNTWLLWLLADSVPALEPYRALGLLWTRQVDEIVDGHGASYQDPKGSLRAHCIALGTPAWFYSKDGVLCAALDDDREPQLPNPAALGDLASGDRVFGLDRPFYVQGQLVPELVDRGFLLELPVEHTWGAMVGDISNICHGISLKFKLPGEDGAELAQEALSQVMRKLIKRRLVFTPGRAPVFSLLTTTIHRCMFSIMNKHNKGKRNAQKLMADLRAGTLPKNFRSLRVMKNAN